MSSSPCTSNPSLGTLPAPHAIGQHAPGVVAANHARTAQCALTYRPDIDGLRAIAVVAVLIYHAFPAFLPGGFTGVDVFFVISGYLITQLVLSGVQAKTFSLRAFYARRVRRLAPALLVVLCTCSAFGWYALTPAEFQWLGRLIGWSAPFLGNGFMAVAGRYFDDTSYLNPLLHLWSLGVEEQFYLLWPILLILSVRHGVTRRALGAVIVTSLIISIWGALDAPAIHFYRLSCRAWELAVGAMLAVRTLPTDDGSAPGETLIRSSSELRAGALSWAGLALILGSAVLLNGDRAFPGWWSAVPVGGAAMLIASGPSTWFNGRILGSAPLTFVGRISYSLYLWHWPALAFSRIVIGRPLSPLVAGCALALASLAACASYYLVERPVRFGNGGRTVVPVLLGGLAVFTVFGVAAAARWVPARLSGPGFAEVDGAATDWQYPGQFNLAKRSGFKPLVLHSHRPQTALFIGDSHIAQYWPRASYVVEEHPDTARSLEFVAYAGCPPLPGVNAPSPGSSCDAMMEYAVSQAFRSDVDTIVLGAFWEGYLIGEFSTDHRRHPIYRVGDPLRTTLDLNSRGTQEAFDEFQRLVSKLVSSGRRVFVVLPNPTSPLFVPSATLPAAARLALRVPREISVDPDRRTIDAAAFEAFAAPVTVRLRIIATETGARIVNPRETLCDKLICAAVAPDGRPLYRDSNHLRPFFARERAVFVDEILLGPNGAEGLK